MMTYMTFTIFLHPFRGHHYYRLHLFDLCMGLEKIIVKEIMQFHYLSYMTTPQHKNPCPRGHEVYYFDRPFLGHHQYILGLSDQCLGVEKKISKDIMQFHDMTYMAMPQHKKSCPRAHEIYNFGRPSNYILTLSVLCFGEKKKILKEIMHFHYIT